MLRSCKILCEHSLGKLNVTQVIENISDIPCYKMQIKQVQFPNLRRMPITFHYATERKLVQKPNMFACYKCTVKIHHCIETCACVHGDILHC